MDPHSSPSAKRKNKTCAGFTWDVRMRHAHSKFVHDPTTGRVLALLRTQARGLPKANFRPCLHLRVQCPFQCA